MLVGNEEAGIQFRATFDNIEKDHNNMIVIARAQIKMTSKYCKNDLKNQ